jgi:hypothetical protein
MPSLLISEALMSAFKLMSLCTESSVKTSLLGFIFYWFLEEMAAWSLLIFSEI